MNKIDWREVLSIAAGILILWLFIDRENKKNKIIELQKEIKDNKNLTNEIKQKLRELIDNNKEIDPEIANELGQIAALIEIRQETKAMLSLVKIIENLLIELYSKDERLAGIVNKNERKRPAFADYLELASNDKVISKEDFHLVSVAKIIRDEEAHKIDVEKDQSKILSSFISGIGIVLALCRIAKGRKRISEDVVATV